jgi:hypothetical protein
MEKKLDKTKLKVGDKLSRISYITILKLGSESGFTNYEVENENGFKWGISGDILAEECYSADQYNETKEVTRTELIEIFSKVGDAVFTVNFNKLPTADDFLALTRDEGNKIRSYKDMEKDFKKLKGAERTLTGYTVDIENGFGRTTVVDLQVEDKKNPLRQIDHRTLNWLICRNIKYVVKK